MPIVAQGAPPPEPVGRSATATDGVESGVADGVADPADEELVVEADGLAVAVVAGLLDVGAVDVERVAVGLALVGALLVGCVLVGPALDGPVLDGFVLGRCVAVGAVLRRGGAEAARVLVALGRGAVARVVVGAAVLAGRVVVGAAVVARTAAGFTIAAIRPAQLPVLP